MSDKILKLDQAQTLYQDLRGRIDALPTSEDIPEVPVQDVQINSTSILQDGVANVPIADANNYGVVKLGDGLRLSTNGTNILLLQVANAGDVRNQNNTHAVTGARSSDVAFYGLAAAAGDTTQKSIVGNGTYTDMAKQKIQNMLGITDLLSTEESSTATTAHALNSTFMMNGKLHRATAAIAVGDAVEVGTNCEIVKADEVFVKKTDYASSNEYGLIKVAAGTQGGLRIESGLLKTDCAGNTHIKAGTNNYMPIVPAYLSSAVYYGLSKLAGVDLANETVTLGTYPTAAKSAIKTMLGIPTKTSDITNDSGYISNHLEYKEYEPTELGSGGLPAPNFIWARTEGKFVPDVAGYSMIRITTEHDDTESVGYSMNRYIQITSGDIYSENIDNNYKFNLSVNGSTEIVAGNSVIPAGNYLMYFNGTDTFSISTSGKVPGGINDVQVNGTSVVSNGVADIPIATTGVLGVVRIGSTGGLSINANGVLMTNPAPSGNIKTGSSGYHPLVPAHQHESTFYGLAKAAGDTTQSASSNAVGTYTEEALVAIHTMLGIDPASIAAQVDIPLIETVSGTTPTITGQPNTRYVCGEVSTISITPPSAGSVDVIFESGSTAAVLTVPNTVKWPAWFDATTLEADTTYEILITDGVYGSVMTWAN